MDVGGIGAYSRYLAKGLQQLNHEVTILAGDPPPLDIQPPVPVGDANSKKVSYFLQLQRLSPRRAASALVQGARLARRVRQLQLQRGIDVLEGPEWDAETFAITRSIPRVIKLHTPSFVAARFDKLPMSISGLIVEHLERRCVERADLITCPSYSLARLVAAHYGLPPERIRVVRNPVDTELFRPVNPAADDPPMVLFVGRLNERKGAHVLARAIPEILKGCPSATFVFAGPDATDGTNGTSRRKSLQTFLADHGVAAHVRFLPRQDRAAIVSLYRASRVCVVPSLYDNLPYSCLEAMASGKAVVGSAVGGIAEMLSDKVNGLLVPAGQPEPLAEAVMRLLRDRGLREELGTEARGTVMANYSIASVAAETVEAYRTAQDRSRAALNASRR